MEVNKYAGTQTDKNVKVTKERIYLQDIADLSCGNPSVLNRCKVIPVRQLTRGKYGRYAGTVLELIRAVQRAEPNLEVIPVGEPEFIMNDGFGKDYLCVKVQQPN